MTAAKPATLGTLEFDAVVSRSETMDADIPEYATEAGYKQHSRDMGEHSLPVAISC